MNEQQQANLSIMEYKVQSQQAVIDKMLPIVEGLVATTGNLVENQKFLIKHIVPKVDTLWDNRSQIKGGWVLASALGGIVIGGASVALVVIEFIKK